MGLQLQSKSFLSKKFCFKQNFETRLRLHINLYIIGRPFNIWKIISMYTEMLLQSRATHICRMEKNPDGHLLKVLVRLFLYLESNQVITVWKVSKRYKKDYKTNNQKDQKTIFLLSLLTLLEFYQHLQTFFVTFSSYRFQMKQMSTLMQLYVA